MLLDEVAGPLSNGSSRHGKVSMKGLQATCVDLIAAWAKAGATKFLTGCFLGFRVAVNLIDFAVKAVFAVDAAGAVPRCK